jgi:hypothetical protein
MAYAQEVLRLSRASGAQSDRGTQMHKAVEDYINGKVADCDPVGKRVVDMLRAEGYTLKTEVPMYLDKDWNTIDKKDRVVTAIMDVLAEHPDGRVVVVDWKTGKQNMIKHTRQGQLYAAIVYHVMGKKKVEVRFEYLDDGTTLVLDLNESKLRAAYAFWRGEHEKMLTYGFSAFRPPDTLDGIPKYNHEWLKDANNYVEGHFKQPDYRDWFK